jgi:hypothetical protein
LGGGEGRWWSARLLVALHALAATPKRNQRTGSMIMLRWKVARKEMAGLFKGHTGIMLATRQEVEKVICLALSLVSAPKQHNGVNKSYDHGHGPRPTPKRPMGALLVSATGH